MSFTWALQLNLITDDTSDQFPAQLQSTDVVLNVSLCLSRALSSFTTISKYNTIFSLFLKDSHKSDGIHESLLPMISFLFCVPFFRSFQN